MKKEDLKVGMKIAHKDSGLTRIVTAIGKCMYLYLDDTGTEDSGHPKYLECFEEVKEKTKYYLYVTKSTAGSAYRIAEFHKTLDDAIASGFYNPIKTDFFIEV